MTLFVFSVLECQAFIVPKNGSLLDHASSFLNGDIQTITCDTGFRAIRPTTITCTEIDAHSAEWQPAPDPSTCGRS